MKKHNYSLSVVVIGRNEASGMERLHRSILPLKLLTDTEFIYVDSASTDNSVSLAKKGFDKVIVLSEHKNLCASAGRFVGVRHADGAWILFLDGDMELNSGVIDKIIKITSFDSLGIVGYVGSYQNHYDDGSVDVWKPMLGTTGVEHFGGAVLLKSEAFMAEDWNPRLFAKEEIDLHSRLRSHGFRVDLIDDIFVNHYTKRFSLWEKLVGNFYPKNSYLGKKFYGFGQLVISRLLDKNIGALVVAMPEPFVFISLLFVSILLVLNSNLFFGGFLLFVASAYVLIRKSPRYLLIYVSYISQFCFGAFKYDRNWVPEVAVTYSLDKKT